MKTVFMYAKTVALVPLFVISCTLTMGATVLGALALITIGDCQGANEFLSKKMY